MSKFSLLCDNVKLWDPATEPIWGSLDFCPKIRQFDIPTLTHIQLANLSQAGAWGDVKDSQHDIASLMIAPSTNIGGEQIFGPAAVWAYPHQGCLTTLVEAAHKLAQIGLMHLST